MEIWVHVRHIARHIQDEVIEQEDLQRSPHILCRSPRPDLEGLCGIMLRVPDPPIRKSLAQQQRSHPFHPLAQLRGI